MSRNHKFVNVFAGVMFAALLPLAAAAQQQGDIVFMIDQSGSMGPDIVDVQNNVNSIATQLDAAGIDFQLGLVGFGQGANSGTPSIIQTLTDDVPTFQAAVNSLVASGGTEPGFQAVVDGMSNAMGNFRAVPVCAILISDEAATFNINANAPATKDDATTALNDRSAVFLGIIDSNSAQSIADYGANDGLAQRTGGTTFDILSFRAAPGPVLQALIQECTAVIKGQAILDIKPQSCPNPLNTGSRGVLPAAILGTDSFDVTEVNVSTVTLEGDCPALRSSVEDVASPFPGPFSEPLSETDCTTAGADGYADLTLKFDKQCVVQQLGGVQDGDVLLLKLEGELNDGTPIEGQDVIRVLKK